VGSVHRQAHDHLRKTGKSPRCPRSPQRRYFNEIEYFLGCVAATGPTTSTPQESRDAVAIALAEKQSAISGRPSRSDDGNRSQQSGDRKITLVRNPFPHPLTRNPSAILITRMIK